ncbi:alpha/beta hydrolase [Achromobacter spanius]|uniref:alpha/beta hydrolase n=1 Tax=Achromobacter spanius TaxID=217203 RepID=UPI0038136A3B
MSHLIDTELPAGSRTETRLIAGPAGPLELLIDRPSSPRVGVAIVTHPQPLLGGTPRHKIPHRLAHGVRDAGWLAIRPSFRGVGASAGAYDHGLGESEDILAVVQAVRAESPNTPLALIGFSFGAYALARAIRMLADQDAAPAAAILAGLPVGAVEGDRIYDTPPLPAGVVLIHGESDTHAPLPPLLAWARPTSHPIIVIPGADHFFTQSQDVLLSLVLAHLPTAAVKARTD